MASPGPNPKRHKPLSVATETTLSSNAAQNPQQNTFTFETLQHLLFGRKANETIDLAKLQKKRQAERSKTFCHVCRVDRPPNGCPFHEPSSSQAADQEDCSLSYAIKSFPQEVQLCTSSIPGAHFGVCAKRVIPEGTWIGPYEGKRVKPEELPSNLDNSYIWEIYENGQASCYIDGSDEGSSSWMRFIRCARHKEEQNLYAFQYLGNVFYRSFKDISKGTEMLVWYDDKYPQYMGIPTGLQEIEFINALDIESPRAEHDKKSLAEQFKQSTSTEQKYDKERLQTLYKPRQHGYQGYRNVHSVPPSLRSTPPSHSPALSSQSTISSQANTEDTRRMSPREMMEAPPLRTNYAHPMGPLLGPALTHMPSGAHGKNYSPVPVNISAGIPSQSVMGRVSGRAHTGITGAHIPLVHEKVLEEGPVIVSTYGRVMLPYNHDNSVMTSTNTNWISEVEMLHQTSQPRSSAHAHLTPQPHSRQSNQPIDMRRRSPDKSHQSTMVSGVTGSRQNVTTVSVNNEIKTASEEFSRSRRSQSQSVSDEALRERGYPVSGNSQRPRSTRRRTSPSRMGVYIWKDEDEFLDHKPPLDECPMFEEASALESDSNSTGSATSSNVKDDGVACLAISDEISMWRCRQCQKTFTQRVLLQVHVCPHEPFKPYRCGQCERSFDTGLELRSHVDTHSSEKPFKCGFCSRSFAGATTLNNHIRTHMGKRPFSCECGKSFAQAGQLARHQRTPGECEQMEAKSES